MSYQEILNKLPYAKPFLFVDELTTLNEKEVQGTFTFDENLDFYKGHFKGNPITPGVILIETMAQIGVVSLGIYLLDKNFNLNTSIALTSSIIDFLQPVLPNEKVTVFSEKIYFRFGKLKCNVKMLNSKNEVVCSGIIAGMVV